MRVTVSESGLIACRPEHQMDDGPWSRVTQPLLAEWARLTGEVRCDQCGRALDRNTKRRDERQVITT